MRIVVVATGAGVDGAGGAIRDVGGDLPFGLLEAPLPDVVVTSARAAQLPALGRENTKIHLEVRTRFVTFRHACRNAREAALEFCRPSAVPWSPTERFNETSAADRCGAGESRRRASAACALLRAGPHEDGAASEALWKGQRQRSPNDDDQKRAVNEATGTSNGPPTRGLCPLFTFKQTRRI